MDFLLQGIFPTQGSNPRLFMSSALAGEFFTTSGTWEALTLPYYLKKSREPSLVVWKVLGREEGRNKILLAAVSLGDAERELRSRGCAKARHNVQVTQTAGIGHDGDSQGRGQMWDSPLAFQPDLNTASHSPAAIPSPTTLFFLPERDAHSLGLPTVHRVRPTPRARLLLTPHSRGTTVTITGEN